MRANAAPGQCGCFNLNGSSAEVAVHAYRNFSIVADITGDHADATSIPGQTLSLLSYIGGPRFRDSSPDVGSTFGSTGIAGEEVVFERTSILS